MRDPDSLPSLRELGHRLGEAAEREITRESRSPSPSERGRRAWGGARTWLIAGVVGALVGAGGVTATEMIIKDGEPVPGEPSKTVQPGVLTDSAAADPGGELPWALRIFTDARGRECFQLGRLRGGEIGLLAGQRFRPFEGGPSGPCGDLDDDPLLFAVERRAQPAPRVVVYGITRADGPVRVRVDDRIQSIAPGSLGSYVAVFGGSADLSSGEVSAKVDGRRVTHRLR